MPERIRSIYREIFDLVMPGGCFLNAELVGPTGPVSGNLYLKQRQAKMHERMKRETAAGRSAQEMEAERARAHEQSSMVTLSISFEENLLWLREAGFAEVDCFWKEIEQAIFGGYR